MYTGAGARFYTVVVAYNANCSYKEKMDVCSGGVGFNGGCHLDPAKFGAVVLHEFEKKSDGQF